MVARRSRRLKWQASVDGGRAPFAPTCSHRHGTDEGSRKMRSNRRKNWLIKRIALGFAVAAFAAPAAQASVSEQAWPGVNTSDFPGTSVQAADYGMPRAMPHDYALTSGDQIEVVRAEPRGTSSDQISSSARSLAPSASRRSWPRASTGTTLQSVRASRSSSWAAEPFWPRARPVASRPPSRAHTAARVCNAEQTCQTSPPTSGKTLARFERRFELAAVTGRRGRTSEGMSVPLARGHRNHLAGCMDPFAPQKRFVVRSR
jgi:hypothetical protein